ncbi:MAG: hypothetical protein XE04_1075 [Marinimicrobia bacterium 46_43]|nr:MAG: hypothetical protein XE04_1075 [Marinimicrobia bacterium 46_43]
MSVTNNYSLITQNQKGEKYILVYLKRYILGELFNSVDYQPFNSYV